MKPTPADSRGSRCGHNFEPNDCPYDGCLLRTQAARIAELTHENQVLVENWDAQEMALLEIVTICGGNAEEARGRSEECYVSIVKTRIAELDEECRNAKEWQAEFSKAADGRYERIAQLEAERDALTVKAAHLYKLSELPFVSLGIVCEDRDKLKHSDRELRKCIANLEAERDALRNALLTRCMQQELAERENAALRKTLEDAPCQKHCASNACREDREPLPSDWPVDWPEETFAPMITRVNLGLACNCRKSRIPEAG